MFYNFLARNTATIVEVLILSFFKKKNPIFSNGPKWEIHKFAYIDAQFNFTQVY